MSRSQPTLLAASQRGCGCDVIPFPAVRRVGKVRRTVEVLLTRSGKGADQYWRQVIDGMRSQMSAANIPEDEIDHQLRAFADLVFGEIAANNGDSAA